MNGTNHISSGQSNLVSGTLLSKFQAGTRKTYVLDLCTHNDQYAASLSNYMVVLFDIHNNNQTAEYVHKNVITGIKCSAKDPSLLFTSSLDGQVNVWDSRCNKAVQTFFDNSTGVAKPLSCFDFNSDESYVCAGTELIREDSFLLFWDRRSSDCLGGYWDSHMADITQVRFHPSVNSCMASASVDGLMNVFDLQQVSEDEAIMYTLNSGCAINKLSWTSSDSLFCMTSLDECQLWAMDDSSPILSLSKNKLSSRFQFPVDYVVDSVNITGFSCLATGANDGRVHLSMLSAKNLKSSCVLEGHTDVVRAICYNSQADVVFTGGEDSCICLWKVSSSVT